MLFSAFGVATIDPIKNLGRDESRPPVVWLIEYPLVEGEKNEKFRSPLYPKSANYPKTHTA
jgi:hypothetical protein